MFFRYSISHLFLKIIFFFKSIISVSRELLKWIVICNNKYSSPIHKNWLKFWYCYHNKIDLHENVNKCLYWYFCLHFCGGEFSLWYFNSLKIWIRFSEMTFKLKVNSCWSIKVMFLMMQNRNHAEGCDGNHSQKERNNNK